MGGGDQPERQRPSAGAEHLQRVRNSFGRQRFITETLAACIETLEPGTVVCRWPSLSLDAAAWVLHAGATATLMDTACCYAALTCAREDHTTLAVESRITLLTAGRGYTFFATGQVLKAGRTLTVCVVSVMADHADEGTTIAHLQATMMLFQEAYS